MLNNFIEKNDKIYKNKAGDKYILTKYGFKPVDHNNIYIQIKEQQAKIKILEAQNKEILNKYEKQIKINNSLLAKNTEIKATNQKLANKKSAYCSCGGLMTYKIYTDYILASCPYCTDKKVEDIIDN